MSAVSRATRLHVPLEVHDALRRGSVIEAIKHLRDANTGLLLSDARDAAQRLAENPSDALDADDPFQPRGGAAPQASGTLPSEVAAKVATGNTRDAAKRLRDIKPGLSEEDAQREVAKHCSPLLREARQETVVQGDSGRYGWLGWVLALVVIGGGLAIWLG
ncbi:hypothetical protein [Luteimonas terrae]|uniref:Ribosomal protein L7/L12 C-terminal domain-containing protein n=1 Tax=Luteimonas terrae TaxID=1530191 RepID=A0A4R5UEV6_9GAMM|nr:hypothetical protein [Luteimonas terrae]TDK33855.1 hypothetical protein E2F49_07695 [Luteimonas terrae]